MLPQVFSFFVAQGSGLFSAPDFEKMFVPGTPILEIFIRGTVSYLGIFVLLRVVLKREAGTLSIADLLVVVMLADAIQNGMADDYRSVTDGLLLICTIVGWSHFINFLSFQYPVIQRLVQPPPLLLVKDGKLQWKNLKKELVTESELMTQVREQGVESLDEIKRAFMESDGRISVITYEKKSNGTKEKSGAI